MSKKTIITALAAAAFLTQGAAAQAGSRHLRHRQVHAAAGAAWAHGHHAFLGHGRRFARRVVRGWSTDGAATRAPRHVIQEAGSGGGVQVGRASFYSGGSRTASGGRVGAATCAHRSLPFGTRVLVTNLVNARQAVLIVNDRGPFVRGRLLDVSRGAAGMLGMLNAGVAQVRMQVLGGAG